jgi:hypothetical protein
MYLKAPEFESDAWAADVGTALHEATQTWQRSLYAGVPDKQARVLGEIQLLKYWPWDVEDRRVLMKLPIGLRTMGNALLLLEAIYDSDFWQEWELVTIEGFGAAIEVPWRIVHRSLGLVKRPYDKVGYLATQGKIDFILRHRVTKRYRAVDLKTTMKQLPAHDASFRFSGQVGQYGMVLDHALNLDWEHNGLDVTYFIAMFADDGPLVYPLSYHLDPEEVSDSIHVKMERLQRMHHYATQEYWPRRAHGCDFYGRPCGFLDICARRDKKFVETWFEFEKTNDRFRDYKRIYEPIWVLEA